MNVGFAVLGSTIKLKGNNVKRINGTLEHYNFICTLLKSDKIKKVHFLSNSEVHLLTKDEKERLDPFNKIVDHCDDIPSSFTYAGGKHTDPGHDWDKLVDYTDLLWRKIKDEKIDVLFCYHTEGYVHTNQYDKVPKTTTKAGTGYRLPRYQNLNYSGNIVNYINKSGIDWYLITPDPRYLHLASFLNWIDTYHIANKILSQYDKEYTWKHMISYEDVTRVDEMINCVYAGGVEKVSVINSNWCDDLENKSNKFEIISNQSSYGPDYKKDFRYKTIKKYIIDENIECNIWGKWKDEVYEDHPEYFKGPIPHQQVDRIMNNTRYSLLIPIMKGWVTGKISEMLWAGVVPFLSNYYDDQCHILKSDHFLRVEDGKELKEKIQFLEDKPKFRIELINKIRSQYFKSEEYTKSGQFLLDLLSKNTGLDLGNIIETQPNKVELF